MSGGSYDYAFIRVLDFIDRLQEHIPRLRTGEPQSEWDEPFEPTPESRAQAAARERFVDHLEKVAKAMRAIEWVDSGDSAPGDEIAPIEACMEGGEALKAPDKRTAMGENDEADVSLAARLKAASDVIYEATVRDHQADGVSCLNAEDAKDAKDAKALETLDWLRQTIHRAHHEGPLDECAKNTCDAARKALGRE